LVDRRPRIEFPQVQTKLNHFLEQIQIGYSNPILGQNDPDIFEYHMALIATYKFGRHFNIPKTRSLDRNSGTGNIPSITAKRGYL
jgi:hypothetical protein